MFSKINVAECSWSAGSVKIEIKMKKAVEGKWDRLEDTGDGGIQQFNTRVWLLLCASHSLL